MTRMAALIRVFVTLIASVLGIDGAVKAAYAADSPAAVLLIYHRFGEDRYPSTSVAMEQFEQHVELLKSDRYTVLPLPRIVEALRSGKPLPDRTVGITIDDAYLSVYERAFPLLQEAGLPFTLFVATDPVDRKVDGYMNWEQIRELHAAGAVIGSQAVTHPHMPGKHPARIDRELDKSAERIAAEIGTRPTLFAYPYGETSLEIMQATKKAGYVAAFGQHSGVANPSNQLFYLPRFPINVNFGGIDRFRRIVEALPLPVSDLVPADPFLKDGPETNPPQFGFTVAAGVDRLDEIACYHSDAGKITALERLGPRIEVRFDRAFGPSRTRINCTMPAGNGRWRWFGMQYYVKP